jgi:hypothetical protein
VLVVLLLPPTPWPLLVELVELEPPPVVEVVPPVVPVPLVPLSPQATKCAQSNAAEQPMSSRVMRHLAVFERSMPAVPAIHSSVTRHPVEPRELFSRRRSHRHQIDGEHQTEPAAVYLVLLLAGIELRVVLG